MMNGFANTEVRVNNFFSPQRVVLALLFASLSALACAQEADEMRWWTSADGNFRIKAKLVGFDPQGIKMLTDSDKTIYVPVGKLSKEGQVFARSAYMRNDDRPSLGCSVVDVKKAKQAVKDDAKSVKLMPAQGLVVVKTSAGGAADVAKIAPLDVITQINGKYVNDEDSFINVMMALEVATDYEIKLVRIDLDGGTRAFKTVTIRLATAATSRDLALAQEKVETAEKEAKQVRDAKMAKLAEKQSPLEITHGGLGKNVIGTPEINVRLKNNRKSDAVAYEIEAQCFNNFGEKVGQFGRGSNVFGGIGQTTIKAGEDQVCTWSLTLRDTTTKVIVKVTRVKLKDGTEWKVDSSNASPVTLEMKQ